MKRRFAVQVVIDVTTKGYDTDLDEELENCVVEAMDDTLSGFVSALMDQVSSYEKGDDPELTADVESIAIEVLALPRRRENPATVEDPALQGSFIEGYEGR